MFKKNKRKKEHRYYRGKRKRKGGFWAKLVSRFLWVSIGFLTILLLMFAFSFYKKLNQPEAKEHKKPILARVQILYACSNIPASRGEDLALKLAKRLEQLKADNLVYEIVEMEKCDFGSLGLEDSSLVKQSLVLDRRGGETGDSPSEVALLTAQALRISTHNVIFKKLKNNYQDISLTILIGNDYKNLFPAVSP